MVYLVGAGPGDSGLITQKRLECIKKADVIIYDHLANPTLLSYAKTLLNTAVSEMLYV